MLTAEATAPAANTNADDFVMTPEARQAHTEHGHRVTTMLNNLDATYNAAR